MHVFPELFAAIDRSMRTRNARPYTKSRTVPSWLRCHRLHLWTRNARPYTKSRTVPGWLRCHRLHLRTRNARPYTFILKRTDTRCGLAGNAPCSPNASGK